MPWFRKPNPVPLLVVSDSSSSAGDNDNSPIQLVVKVKDPKFLPLPAPKAVARKASPTRPSDLKRTIL